tara:strand:- start:8980 stop:9282 length:303 start_codon:yes stop_codon:yes gene_type:complete
MSNSVKETEMRRASLDAEGKLIEDDNPTKMQMDLICLLILAINENRDEVIQLGKIIKQEWAVFEEDCEEEPETLDEYTQSDFPGRKLPSDFLEKGDPEND